MTPAAPVTVITGASGALGSAVCDVLVRRGHRVAALDRSKESLARLDVLGAACLQIETDVLDLSAWPAALDRIGRELGPPTGAVLIAGGWSGGTPVHAEADSETWRQMFEINLETAQRSIRALLPGMVARKAGSVVVIGSRAAERPWENAGAGAYTAAKSALVAYAQVIAKEVLDSNVRINAVLPSTIDTGQNRTAMPAADPTRWVAPQSLAAVIAFLLSDDARDISGAAIPVYGRA